MSCNSQRPLSVLVTGASGMLGHALLDAWHDRWTVYATATKAMDAKCAEFCSFSFENEDFSTLAFHGEPDVIINCAALTDHALCEREPDRAFKINAVAPLKLAQRFPKAYFIQVSTDAVFGAECDFPDENAPTIPQTTYGKAKLTGEKLLLAHTDSLVLRTTIVGFGGRRNTPSLADWIVSSLLQKSSIGLYTDVLFTPVSVTDFILLLEWCLVKRPRGVLHACGPQSISKFTFGMLLAKELGLDTTSVRESMLGSVEAGTGKRFNQSLDSSRLTSLYGRALPDAKGCVDALAKSFKTVARCS